jgi:hypothetical protein
MGIGMSTASGVAEPSELAALIASLKAYRGLVPMSPYTIPSAPRVVAVGTPIELILVFAPERCAGTEIHHAGGN